MASDKEIRRLTNDLLNEDLEVRKLAIERFENASDERVLDILVHTLLNDWSHEVCKAVAKILEKNWFDRITLEQKVFCFLLTDKYDEILKFGEPAIRPLLSYLSEGSITNGVLGLMLAELVDEFGLEKLEQAVRAESEKPLLTTDERSKHDKKARERNATWKYQVVIDQIREVRKKVIEQGVLTTGTVKPPVGKQKQLLRARRVASV